MGKANTPHFQDDAQLQRSSLGGQLRDMRLHRGLTQQQLSNMLGISDSTLSGLEAADRFVRFEVLLELCQILRCIVEFHPNGVQVRPLPAAAMIERKADNGWTG